MANIYFSFLIYGGTALLLFILGTISWHRQKNGRNNNLPFFTWEIICSLFIFAAISGMRWNVGVDYQSYLSAYLDLQTTTHNPRQFEVGFILIAKLLAHNGLHYAIFFGLFAFLQIYFVYYAFKNERYLLPYLGSLSILGFHYLSWMNGMRQMLVATIFVYASRFITQRNAGYYAGFVLLSSLFHKSALILLICYPIYKHDLFPNRIFTSALAVLAIYVGLNPNWIYLLQVYLPQPVDWIGYDQYVENMDVFLGDSRDGNIGPRALSIYLIFFIIVYFSNILKESFKDTNFGLYYNLYVIGFLMSALFYLSNSLFMRPATYFTIFCLPVSAYLLHYFAKNVKKNIIPFLITFLIAASYTPISVVADYGLGEYDFSNYRFYFNND